MNTNHTKSLILGALLTSALCAIVAPTYAQSCQSPTPVWADEFDDRRSAS